MAICMSEVYRLAVLLATYIMSMINYDGVTPT
jgi:hypothetical protein